MKSIALIGSVVAAWTAAMALAFASMGTAQEVLPEQSALMTVCKTATQLGQLGGVNISRCRKVAVAEDGNTALVTVKVWVDGQGVFLVREALQKSAWSQSAIDVQPG